MQGEAQAEEEKAGVAGRPGPDASRRHAAGDLHLGDDEGGERDVGRQSGAVGVDEGLDLLRFFIAGLDLGEEDQVLLTESHRTQEKVKSNSTYILTQGICFCFVLFLDKVTFNYSFKLLHKW